MAERDTPDPRIPESRVAGKRRFRFSLVWIIPIAAALIGAWVAAVKIMEQGPTVTIIIQTAEGLTAGKTQIHYNGVSIGTVKSIRLADDHRHVVATAEMAPDTDSILVEDTKFWVVRPRISGANITGLGTLISGAYIGMEIGKSKKRRHEFIALDNPPIISGDIPGRFFELKTKDLGSVDYGTPIYYRRLQVGRVASYSLDKDGLTLTVKIFVNAPYDKLVTPETRFWQASGIDVSLGAEGFHVQTQSLMSVLVGGLAFETPVADLPQPPAEADAEFTLYSNKSAAFRPPPKHPWKYLLVFDQSVRGLNPGAPVELMGIKIGQVLDVHAEFDAKTAKFTIPVLIEVDPERLGVKIVGATSEHIATMHHKIINTLVAHGMRAQLQTGNLLTGEEYVSIGFFPHAPPFKVDWSHEPARLATVPGKFQGIDEDISGILSKLNKLPYQEMAASLRKSLADLDKTLNGATKILDNADTLMKSNAGLNQQLVNALQEVSRAARSLRVLMDYLERHPESLIGGKPKEKKQ